MVNSLLTAIVRADGDALVMHVGEKPYVVAPSGPVELSSRPLTLDAVAGMLGQLLPSDTRHALDEIGAIEHELPRSTASGLEERFTVVAARGGDDIWIEIRRHRRPVIVGPPVSVPFEPEVAAAPASLRESLAAAPMPQPDVPAVPELVALTEPNPAPAPVPSPAAVPAVSVPEAVAALPEPVAAVPEPVAAAPVPVVTVPEPVVEVEQPALPAPVVEPVRAVVGAEPEIAAPRPPMPVAFEQAPVLQVPVPAPAAPLAAQKAATPRAPEAPAPVAVQEPLVQPLAPQPIVARAGSERVVPPPVVERREAPPEPMPAVVLPLARNPVRTDVTARALTPPRIAGLDRLLRLAAARGANTLYLMANARPSVRVDGEIAVLEGESLLTASEVESLLLDLAPERTREALRKGEGTEWMAEVEDVGRIRCQSFRDHRGPGGIFRMISARPTSAEQLGLSREIQALCAEPEGLILVAGPRASGKSTLISSLVDLVNRTRNDYIITIESQIKFAHESRSSLVSQREVRGDHGEMAAVARAALRENPDVLVIEDLRSPEMVSIALEAVEAGHLVIGSVAAHTSSAAIGRLLEQYPDDRRAQVQLTLADGLRGVIAQVLLRKNSGGRVAARELLLNTASIANLMIEGRISQLPLAIDSGRKYGMVPLNDALAAFVQSGIVDVKEAYRKAYDRQAFLSVLRREGMDTSFVERLA